MKTRRQGNRLLLEELEGRLAPSVTPGFSTNWSGYAVSTGAGAVTAVSGSWSVPTIPAASGTAYSASWVGIDGFSSSTVEQIGTEADLINGHAQYYAWYEMYPRGFVTIPLVIHAGDSISAAVSYNAGSFSLTITNNSTPGQLPFSTNQSLASAKLSSAEWIMEAPSSRSGVLPLANFGTETFTNAKATINNASGAIDSSSNPVYQINMVNRNGVLLDTTSALTNSGSSFSVSVTTAVSNPTPPGHHKGGPSFRSLDQIALVSPGAFGVTSNSTVFTVNSPLNTSSFQTASSQASAAASNQGFGTRRFELRLPGETLDQQDDDGGDGAVQIQTAPAQRSSNVKPPMGVGQKSDATRTGWIAAVDAVFSQDFAVPEDGQPAPTKWTGLRIEEERTVASALVMIGAFLAFDHTRRIKKDLRADEGAKRRKKAKR